MLPTKLQLPTTASVLSCRLTAPPSCTISVSDGLRCSKRWCEGRAHVGRVGIEGTVADGHPRRVVSRRECAATVLLILHTGA